LVQVSVLEVPPVLVLATNVGVGGTAVPVMAMAVWLRQPAALPTVTV
jgi:hypothetical protein